MAIETGGPAFPKAAISVWGDVVEMHKGMTLRDYFAAKAMQASFNAFMMLDENSNNVTPNGVLLAFAKEAYAMADAMLEARK